MNGAAASQAIWTSHGTVTLEALYYAYLNGTLGSYQIYYMDPDHFTTHTMGIDRVLVNGPQQMGQLISEDDKIVTVSASGTMLDISDFDPVHFTANLAPNTKHMVCGWDKAWRPGNKELVRKVKEYKTTGICTCMSLPVPNMIADSLFVILT